MYIMRNRPGMLQVITNKFVIIKKKLNLLLDYLVTIQIHYISCLNFMNVRLYENLLLEVILLYEPFCRLVGLSVDLSVIISSFTSHAPIGALVNMQFMLIRGQNPYSSPPGYSPYVAWTEYGFRLHGGAWKCNLSLF